MEIKILKPNARGCELGDVIITDAYGQGPGCEHCGQLQPFASVISDGNTWWCIEDCAQGVFEEDGDEITKANLNEIKAERLEREKAYIKKRYNQLFPNG